MAACGSLEHIFEKPLPDNSTVLLESLSPWKQIESMKAIADSSFTELFGELHFKESHHHVHHAPPESISPPFSPSSSFSSNSTFSTDIINPVSSLENNDNKREKIESIFSLSNHHHYRTKSRSSSTSSCYYPSKQKNHEYRHSDSFSSMNSDSLSLCTEGLGFESSDDVEDFMKNDVSNNQEEIRKSVTGNILTTESSPRESKISKTNRGGGFPPPISCIGTSGKPWVCFKSYREDGRFILKEIMIPTQELLHTCREDGRLKLTFILADDDEILDETEENERGNKGINIQKHIVQDKHNIGNGD